jgi:hypothetical protein
MLCVVEVDKGISGDRVTHTASAVAQTLRPAGTDNPRKTITAA